MFYVTLMIKTVGVQCGYFSFLKPSLHHNRSVCKWRIFKEIRNLSWLGKWRKSRENQRS